MTFALAASLPALPLSDLVAWPAQLGIGGPSTGDRLLRLGFVPLMAALVATVLADEVARGADRRPPFGRRRRLIVWGVAAAVFGVAHALWPVDYRWSGAHLALAVGLLAELRRLA